MRRGIRHGSAAAGTARLNTLDSEAYLHHVIEHIAEYPVNRAQELLPWIVAELPHGDSPLKLAA